jgi:hypothetical protein
MLRFRLAQTTNIRMSTDAQGCLQPDIPRGRSAAEDNHEGTDNEVPDASDSFESQTRSAQCLAGPDDRHIAGPSRAFARLGSSVAR